MVRDILRFVLEADEDESYKDVFAPEDREYSLEEIRERCPKFFGRENNRFFGTKKRYKYPGNYVVLKNIRTMPGHGVFGMPRRETSWVIYKFKRTQDTPNGDLFFVAHARDLSDARWMIKHQDFRDWKHRAAGLAEADEEEFKDLYTGQEVMRDVGGFQLIGLGNRKFSVQTTEPNVHPKSVTVSREDANYLVHLSDNEFKHACVLDFGVGVFAGEEDSDEIEQRYPLPGDEPE